MRLEQQEQAGLGEVWGGGEPEESLAENCELLRAKLSSLYSTVLTYGGYF